MNINMFGHIVAKHTNGFKIVFSNGFSAEIPVQQYSPDFMGKFSKQSLSIKTGTYYSGNPDSLVVIFSDGKVIRNRTVNGRLLYRKPGHINEVDRIPIHRYFKDQKKTLACLIDFNENVLSKQYNDIGVFFNNRIWVKNSDNLIGYLDTNGNEVIPCQYRPSTDEMSMNFNGGYVAVKDPSDNLYYILDRDGNKQNEIGFISIRNRGSGVFFVTYSNHEDWVLVAGTDYEEELNVDQSHSSRSGIKEIEFDDTISLGGSIGVLSYSFTIAYARLQRVGCDELINYTHYIKAGWFS